MELYHTQQFYSIFELIQICLSAIRGEASYCEGTEVIGMQRRIPGRRNSIESTKIGKSKLCLDIYRLNPHILVSAWFYSNCYSNCFYCMQRPIVSR